MGNESNDLFRGRRRWGARGVWRVPWPARREGARGRRGVRGKRSAVLTRIDLTDLRRYPAKSIRQHTATATSLILVAFTGIRLLWGPWMGCLLARLGEGQDGNWGSCLSRRCRICPSVSRKLEPDEGIFHSARRISPRGRLWQLILLYFFFSF
jgi:hypothetical protein